MSTQSIERGNLTTNWSTHKNCVRILSLIFIFMMMTALNEHLKTFILLNVQKKVVKYQFLVWEPKIHIDNHIDPCYQKTIPSPSVHVSYNVFIHQVRGSDCTLSNY